MGCNKLPTFSTYLVLLYEDGLSKLKLSCVKSLEGPCNFGTDLSDLSQICVWLGCKVVKNHDLNKISDKLGPWCVQRLFRSHHR